MIQEAAEAGKFSAFVVTTLWVHGPWSPLLPAAYEPVLMLFGKLYPPWLIALTGATLSCIVEWINYRVYDWISDIKRLERLKEKATSGRFVKLFRKQPFLVVWIFAWSPLPDWAARIMGVVAGYSTWKYVLAFWLGRLPKFLFLAWLGKQLPLTAMQLTVIAIGAVVIGYGVGWWKGRRGGRDGRDGREARDGLSP